MNDPHGCRPFTPLAPLDAAPDTPDVSTIVACVSVAFVTLAFAHSSAAQEQVSIRVGVSEDPDQLIFGGPLQGRSYLRCLPYISGVSRMGLS